MENIQLLMHGFSTLFTFSNVGAALLGAVLGLVVGGNARYRKSGRCGPAASADLQV